MRRCLALLSILALTACGAGPEPERCAPDTCTEPGTVCVEREDGPSCECGEGFLPEGEACVEPTRCTEATCSGRGVCSDEGGVVTCACEPEYAGPLCERCAEGLHEDGVGGCTDDACTPNPCGSDRRCVAVDGAPVCECPAGSHDEDGDCVPDTTCMDTTCSGRGTCSDEGAGPVCTCEAGWAGDYCGTCDVEAGYHDDGVGGCTTDACLPNPCTEPFRSVCTVEEDGSTSCACDPGYHPGAEGCEEDESCAADTCSGHGTCAVVGGLTECTCDEGWDGVACATCDSVGGYHDDGTGGCTTDPCTPNPCTVPNRSVCSVDAGGSAVCGCDPGYHPDGVGGCTDDPCVPDPCAASGQACRDDGTGAAECYTPVCDDGNPCTDDAFGGGSCTFTPRADGTACSTTLCTSGQQCTGGACGGGTAVSCDDGNPCTDDSCDALTGCANVVDDTIVPDDGIACTADLCGGGVASHTPDDAVCDDGDWCTGDGRCAPTDPSSDGRGCVADDVPRPPGPDATCGSYVCNGGAMRFDLVAAPAGTSCDDRIACTTGDACDGSGACAGTITGDCGSATSCGTTTLWSGSVDVSPARVSGRVLYAGSTTFPEAANSTDITLYLRARDTGVLHRLEDVSFDSTSSGTGYPVTSYGTEDDRIVDMPVLPGVYDVVYRRWSWASSDGTLIYSHYPNDAYAHANRVLIEGVVIGPGENRLDVDVAPARVSGAVLFGGSATFPEASNSTDIAIYLRARDTGVLHRLEDVSFDSTSSGTGFPVTSYGADDDRVIDFPVLPGRYDVVYRRWSWASSDGKLIYSHYPTDAYAHANQVLMEDVVVGAGTTTLNVDVAPVQVTGAVRYAGSTTFPEAANSTDIGIYLRSQDTGVLHRLEDVSFDSTSSGTGFPVTSYGADDDRAIDFPVLPGRYDVVYRRWSWASSDGTLIYSHYPADAYAHANQVLMRDVDIGPGATALEVDVAPVRVSGAVLYGGSSTFPEAANSTDIGIYLRSRDTGVLHRLEDVSFDSTSSGTGYPVTSYGADDDRAIDFPVLPGAYDVVYRRWSWASSDGTLIYSHYPTDAYAHANQVLARDVAVGPGSTSLDVDVAPARLSGALLYGGSATFPEAANSTDIGIYLRSRDTGILHRLEDLSFDSTSSGTGYPVTSYGADDDRAIDFPVLPGTYDVVYRRWSWASSDGRLIYSHYPADAYAHANQALIEGVVVGATGRSLDVDVAPARVGGSLVYAGATSFPEAANSTDIGVYLRSRATGVLHRLEEVSFDSTSSGTGYPVTSYGTEDDRAIDLPALPGLYDLVYRRWSWASSDGRLIYSHYPTDAYSHANLTIGACVEVR